MALKFKCTGCGEDIIVRYLKVGEVARCRNCGAEMAVPPTAVATTEKPSYEEPLPADPVERSEITEAGTLAGRWERLGAWVVDSLISWVPYLVTVLGERFPALVILGLLGLVGVFVIQLVFLSIDGQTIGKKVLKVKIVKVSTGKNGGFVTNVLLRVIVSLIPCIIPIYPLVDVLFIFRQDRRCIHDFIAGTRVVNA